MRGRTAEDRGSLHVRGNAPPVTGAEKPTTAAAKDFFKGMKTGTAIKLTLDEKSKVMAVQLGYAPKKNPGK
jgi:hypothetical protein